MDDRYSVLVQRDPNVPKGAGVAYLYDNDEVIDQWDVITGGDELDASKYGGITPPIDWRMVEAIDKRIHPKTGRTLDGARLYPCFEEDMDRYVPPRTVDLDEYAFYTHPMGISTGCLGPKRKHWTGYKKAINSAWIANGGSLIFTVEDINQ